MTDQLYIVQKMAAYFCENLIGNQAERDTATVLAALEIAIELGAVNELAALVKPWMDGRLVEGVAALRVDDSERESAIAGLAKEAGL